MVISLAIQAIANKIPSKKGYYFDSHFIINQLIQHFSNEYHEYICKYSGQPEITKVAHSQLGREVENALLEIGIFQVGKSYSTNIHNINSECTLYQKR